MDYNALRARTLDSGRDEEAVTVNTRALIDKVLARYSGEWTVLRELLQNAADASAKRVTIRFETLPSSIVPVPQNGTVQNLLKHTVQHHTLKRLVVSNDGTSFNENDWSRLKRIAEGNPDETKIGAFGVGFYSTFADCEEPLVSSGSEAMAFYWKGNSLFTRRLQLSPAESTRDTNFVLDYRNATSNVPPLLPLAQFLASSLTFVGIEQIELFLDQTKLLTLTKKTAPSQNVPIPRDVEPKTSEGYMKVSKVSKEVAQIDGNWMKVVGWQPQQSSANRLNDRDPAPSLRNFFSRLAGSSRDDSSSKAQDIVEASLEDLTVCVSATIFLNVNTATINTYTGLTFNQELERATKKPPPKTTSLAILTAPYVENDHSATASTGGDVFATVLPTRSGRIFIGFPTHQTTGLSAHISAPSVIPTVERESIDLNARYVKTWNVEMLRAAGIVCRIAWAAEMLALKEKINFAVGGRSKIRMEDVAPLLPEAITTSKNFSFRESTPSAQTGQIIEDAFWTCNRKAAIDVLSTNGVLPTHQVRIAPKDLSFMEGIPILPEQLVTEAKAFVDKLIDFGLVTEVTVTDIRKALEANALSSKQVGEFLSWITKQPSQSQLGEMTIKSLLSAAVANDESTDGTPSRVLVLGGIQFFLNPSKIPIDLPMPPNVMPFKFTKSLSKNELERLGWQEMQIVPWIRWLLSVSGDTNALPVASDMTKTPSFSAIMLAILSKQWDNLSQSSRSTLVELLAVQTVVPTKLGLRKPSDAYFPSVKLFDDLAVVTGLHNVKDKFLVALGVRKTLELGVVFARLLAPDSKVEKGDANNKTRWSHVNLIEYLASVRDDIPAADIQKLKSTPICPREERNDSQPAASKRYLVSDLFEPRPVLRDLGLPVLEWPGPYRSGSSEGRLLSTLGLRTTPTVIELIDIMAASSSLGDLKLWDKAMTYFLSNHVSNGYGNFDYLKVTTPFLPLESNLEKISTPSQCFVEDGAALLGFDILKRELHQNAARFGVRTNPPMVDCIDVLAQKPPSSSRAARGMFAYFAGRLNEINSTNLPRLSELNFIPVVRKVSEKATVKHVSPKSCFLGDSDVFGDIFNYVDFGQEANAFLLKCGSKHEPTKVEIAQILVREPARISSTFRSPEKYLALLRSLADSLPTLRKHKDLFKEMKSAAFLLASKEISNAKPRPKESPGSRAEEIEDLDEDDAQGIREWHLTAAQEAIIVDDYLSYNLFKTSILAVPQEELLEDFYHSLGAPLLSNLVEEAARHGPKAPDQKPAYRLQNRIYERARLFLHDQPPDTIKHDTKWLEKNLQVQLVSSISLRRSLKGRDVTHVEKRSAVVTQVNKEYTLWITGDKPDLYQVSQALVQLLLTRQKLHSALTLEMLLKTDLLDLKARGFNVSRILKQKAAEARLAESRRQQELEAQQRQIEEQEEAWKAAQTQAALELAQRKHLPGDFPDSPEAKEASNALIDRPVSPIADDVRRQPKNLFSNLTRQLGLGDSRRQLQNFLGNNTIQDGHSAQPRALTNGESADPPPPYAASQKGQNNPNSADQPSVTSPAHLQNNLLSAIRKSRAHNSSSIFSRGETNTVTETQSYCDERPATDLQFAADIRFGIQMFLSPSAGQNASSFLAAHSSGLTSFAGILNEVAGIFSLDPKTLNIFFDPNGKTIAFNSNGSIFCNYLYFQQLHEKSVAGGVGRSDALTYWFVILCHELAHNLVADHSSNHSYYTEALVVQYFGRVVKAQAEGEGSTRKAQA